MKWHTLKDDAIDSMPAVAGVYAIYGDGRLLYVGSSEDLRKRVVGGHAVGCARYSNTYVTPWGYFKSVTVKHSASARCGDWLGRELRLIKRLRPRHNQLHTKRGRAARG